MEDDVSAFVEAWMIDNAHVLYDIIELEAQKRGEVYCAALTRFPGEYKTRKRPDVKITGP
jgi:hypothetical protein